jgi:FtsH-binding integral membrane protein
MDTRRLQEGSRLIGATSWAAIAAGVFVALALHMLLMLFGLAVVQSVGDRTPGGGFAIWAIIVQLGAIAVGAALAAALTHSERRGTGIAAGVMTWAVALVLGGSLSGFALAQRFDGAGVWSVFLGALLALGAAVLGGGFGASLGRTRSALGSGTPMTPVTPGPTAAPLDRPDLARPIV